MKKLAILLSSTGWGGLEMNIVKLAKLLMEFGWDITLITTETAVAYKNENGFYNQLHVIKPAKKYLDISAAKRISKILKASNVNTLFVGYNKDIALASMTKRFFISTLKIVYQQQMQLGLNKKDPVHTFRFNSIDRWITPLPWLKQEIIERTRFDKKRIKVIPLGVNVDKLANSKYTKDEARQKLDIKIRGILIGVIGRIDPDKGQKFLVESVIELRKQGIDISLLIFGSPTVNSDWSQKYYAELKSLVQDNNLEERIYFKGHSKDVQLFYNAVDIFTMSSKSETFGMVTVESMISGVMVIGANTGGTPELLENGALGLVYEYGNIEDYCEKVKWVIDNEQEAAKMKEEARIIATKKYSDREEARQIDQLLLSLN